MKKPTEINSGPLLKHCCGQQPVFWIPATLGGEVIDKELKPSIECTVCGMEVAGEDQNDAKEKWNNMDHWIIPTFVRNRT